MENKLAEWFEDEFPFILATSVVVVATISLNWYALKYENILLLFNIAFIPMTILFIRMVIKNIKKEAC